MCCGWCQLVCRATVNAGEVNTGPTYSVNQPLPAEGEAAMTHITVLYKQLHTLYLYNAELLHLFQTLRQ